MIAAIQLPDGASLQRTDAVAFSGLTTAGSGATSFGPRITWAAFDLGRVRQRVVAADARAEATLARFEQTVLLALEEIDSALVTYGRELEQTARLRESAAASERATELARLRYQDGVSDFLTVLDAERRLLESQDTLARSETRAAVALVGVFRHWLRIPEGRVASVVCLEHSLSTGSAREILTIPAACRRAPRVRVPSAPPFSSTLP